MNKAEIIKQVQARMSDLMPGDQVEVNSNSLTEALIDYCAESFYMKLPTNVLPATSFLTGAATTATSDEVSVKRIQVPDNFIRLVSFKFSDWIKNVNTTIPEGSNEHKKQFHKYSYGGNTRPVVTLVSGAGSIRCVEYYSALTSIGTVTQATCVVKGTVEDMPDTLIDAFAWHVAATVLLADQEYDAAKAAEAKVNEYILLHQQ